METKTLNHFKSFKYILPVWYNNKSLQQKIITGLMLVLLVAIAYLSSVFIWRIVLPPEYKIHTTIVTTQQTTPLKVSTKNNANILAENTWFGISPDLAVNNMQAETIVIETALNLSLKGTIMGSKPRAFIVDNETGKTHLVKLNEEIIPNVKLSKIDRRQVVIINNGKTETLSLPNASLNGKIAQQKKQPTYTLLFKRKAEKRQKVKIPASDVSYALSNLGALANQAKLIPRVSGSTIEGYKIMRMKNNSFLRKLSLKEGDILLKLDNVLISDKAKMFPMLMSLKDAKKARLLIHRQGKNIALDIQVI